MQQRLIKMDHRTISAPRSLVKWTIVDHRTAGHCPHRLSAHQVHVHCTLAKQNGFVPTCRMPSSFSCLSRCWQPAASICMCMLYVVTSQTRRHGAPGEDIPLVTATIPIPLGVLCVVARMFIIVEDIINFRSLPPSVYASVDWTAFLSHF
ncbi:hypothetical protein GGR53DRAFT_332912 [Hypoxylon sp. FL1150]|nr:hypothetical protein GGR53DRAFT_332912 [Hypoxylon sp. FL1150]